MKVPFYKQKAVPETAKERAHYYARTLRPEPSTRHVGWLDTLVAAAIVTAAIYCLIHY